MRNLYACLMMTSIFSGCWTRMPEWPEFPELTEAGRKVRLIQGTAGCQALAKVEIHGTTDTEQRRLEESLQEKVAQAGGNALLIKKVESGTIFIKRAYAVGEAFKCP